MSIVAVNARNQFKGKIREIVEGPVVSEVDVQTSAGIVTATITTRSIKQLGLTVGSEVLALIKSSDVLIARLREASADSSS
ncbi:TOBE domain-containing protein [Thiobaca trueperi]|uniref:Molybdopterin-binding protein n=1 Tax=Thiobaca trueperi TaxID=127458 RepID=A0A4R3MT30_9GAMM|nr:TOBE domain-containing protein [Thiobaca trueperi]TCT19444.1 molybdopterin-binding protein [Thiobaca trueperi]